MTAQTAPLQSNETGPSRSEQLVDQLSNRIGGLGVELADVAGNVQEVASRVSAQSERFTHLQRTAETMVFADAPIIRMVLRLPEGVVVAFNWITDFGKSVRFLVPIAVMLAVIATLASPALTSMSQRVLAGIAVRLGFLFAAIALPGLVFTIVKRLIGRARPLVGGSLDPFLHHPGWSVEYASLPSGHATDAAAVATAIGALWPRTRPLMWTYAALIALSRVVLTAHYPSDVIAGVIVGAAGALLVRDWFAARGLAFTLAPDGAVRPMPGPSFARIKRVARQLIAP